MLARPASSPPLDADLRRRAEVHAALGDPHRLAIVDALRLSDRSPAELAAALGIASNLLAHHLDVLEGTGLVERSVSHGDRRRRYLRLRSDRLGEAIAASAAPKLGAPAVLFVCTGNSARSPLAAALWNTLSPTPASSAGTRPAARLHPGAVAAGRRAGLDLRGVRPRHRDDVREPVGLLVTVCDEAHESWPPEEPAPMHWSLPDPAAAGTRSAFDQTVRALRPRVEALARAIGEAS